MASTDAFKARRPDINRKFIPLNEDDLAGHVLAQGGWEVVSFPAVAEEDEAHAVETPRGPWTFRRAAGEALDPEREPLPALESIRSTIGEMNFAAQYQQRPAPAGGGLFKAAWLQHFRLADPPPFDRMVQSWDTANKPSELADYSVCTTWGVKGPRFYLMNVLRKKLSYPELRRAVIEQDRLFKPQAIVIEDRASGTQLDLSGGNQQKVVLARWLALRPKVLIVDEPTRGIDIGAKVEVHNLLFEMARSGIAIIAISSELPEVLAISDRIVAMREGRVTGSLDRESASQEALMAMMTLSGGAHRAGPGREA